MEKRIRTYNLIGASIIFVALPILIFTLSDFPKRSFIKELISLLTILSFSLMTLQFYLSRANKKTLSAHKMSRVLKIHKIIGYVFLPILLIHPFLVIGHKLFESGLNVDEAFLTIISNYSNFGILLGIISWVLMILLGLSSIFRKKLRMKYTTWRLLHGILSILFLSFATIHALDLGRHTNTPMSILLGSLALGGIVMLLIKYKKDISKNIIK